MKIWVGDDGDVVMENDDQQRRIPMDMVVYLMRMGTSVQRDQVKSDRLAGDDKLLAKLNEEARL